MRFYASDMIMKIHSDPSYLSAKDARSLASGHFCMGSLLKENEPIILNREFYSLCAILKFVASSAAEAELGALLLNIKAGEMF